MARRKRRDETPVLRHAGEPDSLAGCMQRYAEWLRIQNYSERTVDNRQSYLGFFIAWCEARSLIYPQEITKPILERYQRHLFHLRKDNGKPLTFQAQYSRLVPVRAFFKWLTRQNVLLYNPASELQLPKLEHRLPRHVLTAIEAEAVLNQPDIREPMGLRDRAILEVFYSTGVRRSELMRLSVFDLDLERGTLMVRQGKGKKDRMVPIGARAVLWVRKYLDDGRPQLAIEPDDGTLFLNHLGESFTPNGLSQLVRNHVNAAELGKTGSCHLFRHTMATLMLEGGADIRYIQAMLGHVRLDTTQIYTQVSIRRLKHIHSMTHPGSALKPPKKAMPAEGQGDDGEPELAATPDVLFVSLAADGAEEDGGT